MTEASDGFHSSLLFDEGPEAGGDMTDPNSNLIASEWRAGEAEIENRKPSDLSDLIGRHAPAGAGQQE